MLIHPDVQRQLGPDMLAEAVFNALDGGRMGVLPNILIIEPPARRRVDAHDAQV